MPRHKTTADRAYNARRRAQRMFERHLAGAEFRGNPYPWNAARTEHDAWGRHVALLLSRRAP